MYPSQPLTRRHHQNYTWDKGTIYTTCTLPHPPWSPYPPPSSPHTLAPAPAPSSLPSRIAALNRRAAIVSANLAHLTTVVKPLETTPLDCLTEAQLLDMEFERAGLEHAMREFREAMGEVGDLLREIRGRMGWGRIGGVEEMRGRREGAVRRVRSEMEFGV
ncbi:hypothetical protein J1614_000641 [Plenodomus biglobosus]|nr:hypothetical protein J1614_000641 [Plenodomus biglobosus]